ncbi:MAG TPA: hypothetical protein VGM58_01295 [Verrucomicrobiae bacterium]|jgi:hypothetical protein
MKLDKLQSLWLTYCWAHLSVMKIFISIVGIVLVLALLFLLFLYGSATADRRARFINTMSDLKEAHFELQKYGAFTNRFQDESIYSYTNQFRINGTNYQCEFAVECADFQDRGFLTITTNEIFIWVDKKRGVMPLVRPLTFQPGI